MPTARPRHPVTETDDVAAALDAAERRWPDVPRSRLIPEVLVDWAGTQPVGADRTRALRALVGSLPGSGRLYDRDRDWPE